MGERLSPRNPNILLSALALTAGALLCTFAFSKATRDEIIKRDKGCVHKSNECMGDLEAAHIDHTRNENYDKSFNGRALCTYHHLLDHILRTRNGLTTSQNEYAIQKIRERLPYL